MQKKITTDQVRIGMYVERFCGAWIDHPFWSSKLLIEDRQTLQRIQESAITELVIDVSKGLDVVLPAPADEIVSDEGIIAEQPPAESPPKPTSAKNSATSSMADEILRARQIFSRGKQAVKDMFKDARLGQVVNTHGLNELIAEMNGSLSRNPHGLLPQ